MSTAPKLKLSPQEYAAHEERADFRSEFYQGEMFAMAGASREHNLIVTNVSRELSSQLKSGPCEVYASDMRVKIEAAGLYTCPGLVVVCDHPRFDADVPNTLLNPIVLIEVLSDSTEGYDRGVKFRHCRRIPTLREYVRVSQHAPVVEWYAFGDDRFWTLHEANGLSESIRIESIACTLELAEAFAKVSLREEMTGLPPILDEPPR